MEYSATALRQLSTNVSSGEDNKGWSTLYTGYWFAKVCRSSEFFSLVAILAKARHDDCFAGMRRSLAGRYDIGSSAGSAGSGNRLELSAPVSSANAIKGEIGHTVDPRSRECHSPELDIAKLKPDKHHRRTFRGRYP